MTRSFPIGSHYPQPLRRYHRTRRGLNVDLFGFSLGTLALLSGLFGQLSVLIGL